MRSPQCTPMLILPCYHGDLVHKALHLCNVSHGLLGNSQTCTCMFLNSSPLGSHAVFSCQRDNVTSVTKGAKTTSVPFLKTILHCSAAVWMSWWNNRT